MTEVIIASQNPVKTQCVKNAFEKVFGLEHTQFTGVSVASEVSDQPMTDEETYTGALNRTQNAKKSHTGASFWVGIEGGIDYHGGKMEAFAWVIVISKNGKIGEARTASFTLPTEVQRLVEGGMELGHADDQVFERKDSKKKSGAVGILTNDLITRTTYYEQAMILALIPFVNSELF